MYVCLFIQGFLPLEGKVIEVEVWGLGGKAAKEVQNAFKKREELFTEQRRKVNHSKGISFLCNLHFCLCIILISLFFVWYRLI